MIDKRCKTCVYFWKYPDSTLQKPLGHCRRKEPFPDVACTAGVGYIGMWPVVDVTLWCGEWKSKDDADMSDH